MTNFYRTPFWLLKPQRAGLRSLVVLGSLALSSAGVVGCGPQSAPPTDATSSSPSWGSVLQNWWQATTAPPTTNPTPPPAASPGTPSQNEVAKLARQHPAWKLADALQENRIAALQFESITPGAIPGPSLSSPGFDVQFGDGNSLSGSTATASSLPAPASAVARDSVPPHVLEFGELHQVAHDQQETSLADFLQSVTVRQQDWQRDYRAILQTALGENVEAAARRLPETIALVLPAPDTQLEMTNLRLRLLRNVFTTEEEREAARNRLRELLLQWRAALREQETARAKELQRLRNEEPERIRSEGLVNIQQELTVIERTQEQLRLALAAEHRARLEEDFGNERARLALSFPLPSSEDSSLLSPGADTASRGNGKTGLEQIIFHRTPAGPPASSASLSGIAPYRSTATATRAEQIRALRQLAWSDATRQAKMAARLGY